MPNPRAKTARQPAAEALRRARWVPAGSQESRPQMAQPAWRLRMRRLPPPARPVPRRRRPSGLTSRRRPSPLRCFRRNRPYPRDPAQLGKPRAFLSYGFGGRRDRPNGWSLGRERGAVPLGGFTGKALRGVAGAEVARGVHGEDGGGAERHQVVPIPGILGLGLLGGVCHCLQLRVGRSGVGWRRASTACATGRSALQSTFDSSRTHFVSTGDDLRARTSLSSRPAGRGGRPPGIPRESSVPGQLLGHALAPDRPDARRPRARRSRACPSQPNVFYIGFDNGGVWRSTDYGSNWTPLFDREPTGSIGAIARRAVRTRISSTWARGAGIIRPDLADGRRRLQVHSTAARRGRTSVCATAR